MEFIGEDFATSFYFVFTKKKNFGFDYHNCHYFLFTDDKTICYTDCQWKGPANKGY